MSLRPKSLTVHACSVSCGPSIMRWTFLIALNVAWLLAAPADLAVDPVPEGVQAALALKILERFHGTNAGAAPRKLHIAYFTPSDRDPEPRYHERLSAIMEDIRAFYREGMEKAGFGPKTFEFARDAERKPVIHVVK